MLSLDDLLSRSPVISSIKSASCACSCVSLWVSARFGRVWSTGEGGESPAWPIVIVEARTLCTRTERMVIGASVSLSVEYSESSSTCSRVLPIAWSEEGGRLG